MTSKSAGSVVCTGPLQFNLKSYPVATSASAHEVDDLHFIVLLEHDRVERGAFEHREIELDGNAARVDGQVGEQFAHRERVGQFAKFPIQSDSHWTSVERFAAGRHGQPASPAPPAHPLEDGRNA